METRQRRRQQSDAALRWWGSLNEQPPPQRPSYPLGAALGLSALVAVVAVPMVWHHLLVPSPTYSGPDILELISGLETASWLIAVAIVAVALAVHSLLRTPGIGTKMMVTVLAVVTANSMFIDYFDWSRRGVSLQVGAYFGPGFFVGLGCAGVLVMAAFIAWRAPG